MKIEREGLSPLLHALSGETRVVGGAVRDTLAGIAVRDIDLATVLSPQDVLTQLEKAGIKAVPTGITHGTITAVLASGPVEITTLRRDVSTDGRHATVAYTDDWREDAARRDFTINALYFDPVSGTVFDYFGGQADLRDGIVRFIGDPLERIAEDHLRILRFFRFHARFGKGTPDAAAITACAARANDLMALSRERIADELLKLLSLPKPAATIRLMIANGIFKPVLPEIVSAEALERLVEVEREGSAIRRLASLVPEAAEDVAKRLRLSKAQTKRLVLASARRPSDVDDPRALAYRLGREAAEDRLLLLNRVDALAQVENWAIPGFPLTGGAIVARGVGAGPDVARLLKAIEDRWIAEGFPPKDRVEVIADEEVGGRQA